jgi:hypothetical protein
MSRGQVKNNSNKGRNSKQSTSSTFIKGRIYSVITDETHPFFDKILGEFDPTYIGYVFWGDVGLKAGSIKAAEILKLPMAKSYFNWLTYPPLITEIVDIIKIPSSNHYIDLGGNHTNVEHAFFPPINVWNNSVGNILPREADIVQSDGEIPIGKHLDQNKIFKNKNMLPFEGDMILEGRFGNSIRFGSSNPRGKNNWSENDSDGEPITIISNGQTEGSSMALENINNDASSIYLTSNQNIDNLNIASKNFNSLEAKFTTPQSGLTPLKSFANNSTTIEMLRQANLIEEFSEMNAVQRKALVDSMGIDSNFQSQPNEILEGIQPQDIPGDDASASNHDGVAIPGNSGFEKLVKIPGSYVDNNRISRELYIVPKRFTSKTCLVTSILGPFLMKLLLAAEKEGVKIIVNSGFRPPLENIYLDNRLIQKSQKTVRLKNLLPKYKGKLKEPWLLNTTVIEPFDGYQVGDSYEVSPQSKHFTPLTAPSFYSPHGRSMACDFSTNSATNQQYKWMCKNGWKYGFIRTVYSEPWHFGYLPSDAKNGPTAKLKYKYEPGIEMKNTTNRWNNVFGSAEPNWDEEYIAFQNQQAQELNA